MEHTHTGNIVTVPYDTEETFEEYDAWKSGNIEKWKKLRAARLA